MSRRLNDISSEELLNSLNDEKLEVQSSPVYDFIERFDLKSGNFKVPSLLLFNIFLKYYPESMILHAFKKQAAILLNFDTRTNSFLLNKESKLLHYEATKPEKAAEHSLPNSVGLQRHLETWLKKINITKGKLAIPWFVLYDLYRCYCVDIKFRSPKTYKTFNNYMKFHYDFHMNDSGPVYFINVPEGTLPNKGVYGKLKEKYKINSKKSF